MEAAKDGKCWPPPEAWSIRDLWFFILFACASFADMTLLRAEDHIVVHISGCMMLR
jgi:hypothetical protein